MTRAQFLTMQDELKTKHYIHNWHEAKWNVNGNLLRLSTSVCNPENKIYCEHNVVKKIWRLRQEIAGQCLQLHCENEVLYQPMRMLQSLSQWSSPHKLHFSSGTARPVLNKCDRMTSTLGHRYLKVKYKAISATGHWDLYDCVRSRIPHFLDNLLTAGCHLRASRALLLRNIYGTHFCYRLSQTQDHSATGRIKQTEKKNQNNLIGLEPVTFQLVA
jgi:hypothetical protein